MIQQDLIWFDEQKQVGSCRVVSEVIIPHFLSLFNEAGSSWVSIYETWVIQN